jgi:hypothetical protein
MCRGETCPLGNDLAIAVEFPNKSLGPVIDETNIQVGIRPVTLKRKNARLLGSIKCRVR